jgi:hypothetical protein
MWKQAALVAALCGAVVAAFGGASAHAGAPAFSNTQLLSTWSPPDGLTTQPNANSTGNSEPAIAFGPGGSMAVDGLAWLPYQVNLWKGQFGDMPPSYFGGMDTSIPVNGNGRFGLGSGDADLAISDAGTTLLADLDFIFNHRANNAQLGVSVTRCPADAAGPSDCSTKLLDQAGVDRPWLTVSGQDAWLSYHDSGNSTLIHVLRSTDDGRTWQKVGDPIVGQAKTTGNATFNNDQGPLVADPSAGNVYAIYASGEASVQKGTSADFNNIIVSRSSDGGQTWTANLVFHAPRFTALNNIFPALAVDPSNGTLYAAWSDQHAIWVSTSTDQARTWSDPVQVSNNDTATVVMPWVAALDGKVDVVYYGSSAGSVDDSNAVWNVYDAQSVGGSPWSVGQVSKTPNRVGAVCLNGAACRSNRQLLDLFEVAEDPLTHKAAVVYTDSTIDTYTFNGNTNQLPEIVLAYEQ